MLTNRIYACWIVFGLFLFGVELHHRIPCLAHRSQTGHRMGAQESTLVVIFSSPTMFGILHMDGLGWFSRK